MSRDKFEEIYGRMGFDLTRMYVAAPEPWSEYEDEKTGYAWAGWLAGRESMRDEAAEQFWLDVQGDLENGVKSLNEEAAKEFQRKYPSLYAYGAWINRDDIA